MTTSSQALSHGETIHPIALASSPAPVDRLRQGRHCPGMTALAFDTHKAVKTLQEAGAGDTLAEAVVATIGDALETNVATKVDLKDLEMAVKADIADLKADIAATNADMRELETGLRADMRELETSLRADIAELKADMREVETSLKADIGELETSLKADIAAVRADMATKPEKADLSTLEARIVKWLVPLLLGQAALIVALVKLL